jgi:YjbE family integral membrane protein
MELNPQFFTSLLQIIWIDLLLSGDNAVVIALACRSLPPKQRKWGIILGAGAAVVLRIIFALIITVLLGLPYLKLIGGILLFWIAIKLVGGEDESHGDIAESDTLWRAVRTVAIADAVMSLDNVVAIAAASKGHPELFIFGLLLSIPLIVYGAQVVMTLIARFPLLVWAGAALLGWIAGEMIVGDSAILKWWAASYPWLVQSVPVAENPVGMVPTAWPHYLAAACGAAIVIISGLVLRRKNQLPA